MRFLEVSKHECRCSWVTAAFQKHAGPGHCSAVAVAVQSRAVKARVDVVFP